MLLQLVDLFGGYRDEWIARDLDGWLHANIIYDGLPQILTHLMQHHDLYIVTTKQVKTLFCLSQAKKYCAQSILMVAFGLCTSIWIAIHRR